MLSSPRYHHASERDGARSIFHPGSAGMALGGVIAGVGSLLPWVFTPFGSLGGAAGPGLWTLSAAVLALAGALLAFRGVALVHALIPGIAMAGIATWQVARILQISATTDTWGRLLPAPGLAMVAGGAVILFRTAWRLHQAR